MKHVIVTGGGTGIGLATVRLMAARGWNVTAAGLERDEHFPEAATFVEGDVTDPACVARSLDGVDELAGLVTCAGIIRYADEWDPAVFDRVLSVNVTGAMAIAGQAAAALERGRGAIVTVASMWSWFGNPVAPAYGTSKGAVAALTRALAVAWGPRGIRVNAVAPGWVNTRISENARQDPVRRQRIDARIPLGRWAEPEDIAPVVAFLLSEDAAYVHGTILPVDGGYLAS